MPATLLEIGPGPGIATRTLSDLGVKTCTLDIDPRINPNVCGDVCHLPFRGHSFDVILAAEVLEHIPYAEVPAALAELSRVARRSIVITLPHFSNFAPSVALKIFPFIPRFSKVFPISIPTAHHFDGQHYWEIGKNSYSLSTIKRLLVTSSRFRLVREYLIEENPYHHMFVLNRENHEFKRNSRNNNE